MSLVSIAADMSELREVRLALVRIAEALERLSPPLPGLSAAGDGAEHARRAQAKGSHEFTFAESPEQYQERVSSEAALAISLGVAPWSPAFQQAVLEMKDDIMRSSTDEEEITSGRADDLVRQAFQAAKAEANER